MINNIIYFQAFVIGTCIGSFLNVIIYRFPNDLSIIKPRSFCPSCNTQLTWRENIPFISWFIQGGKCKTCKTTISFRYPLIELLTGFLFIIFLNIFLATLLKISKIKNDIKEVPNPLNRNIKSINSLPTILKNIKPKHPEINPKFISP